MYRRSVLGPAVAGAAVLLAIASCGTPGPPGQRGKPGADRSLGGTGRDLGVTQAGALIIEPGGVLPRLSPHQGRPAPRQRRDHVRTANSAADTTWPQRPRRGVRVASPPPGRRRGRGRHHDRQPDQPVLLDLPGFPRGRHQPGGRGRDHRSVQRRLHPPAVRPGVGNDLVWSPTDAEEKAARPYQRRDEQPAHLQRGDGRQGGGGRAHQGGPARRRRAGLRENKSGEYDSAYSRLARPGFTSATTARRPASIFTGRSSGLTTAQPMRRYLSDRRTSPVPP